MQTRHRILCVDDDPMNIDILEYILQDGFEIIVARSGIEALEILQRVVPDMVLLDIMMPQLDGYETCRRIRAMPGLQHVKVLLVSAKAQTSDRLRGYEAGADDYITKPFDEDELLAKIRVFLRLKSAEEVDSLQANVLTLVSHEMRTPLSGVMAPAEILASDEPLSVADRKEWASIITQCATKLSHLIDRCLQLCQYRAGLVRPKNDSVDLGAVLRDTVEKVCTGSGSPVTLPAEGTSLEVAGDAEALHTVAEALLEHATRNGTAGEAVTVAATTEGETRVLTMRVPGLDLDPTTAAELFEAFLQADVDHHSRSDAVNLALAREIARSHGGDVSVEADPEQGTAFRVVLPVTRNVLESAPSA